MAKDKKDGDQGATPADDSSQDAPPTEPEKKTPEQIDAEAKEKEAQAQADREAAEKKQAEEKEKREKQEKEAEEKAAKEAEEKQKKADEAKAAEAAAQRPSLNEREGMLAALVLGGIVADVCAVHYQNRVEYDFTDAKIDMAVDKAALVAKRLALRIEGE